MPKSEQQSRVRIFATNAPDPPCWTPNSCFGPFRTILLLHELQCSTGRTGDFNAQVEATKSRWNFSQRTHPIHLIGPQTHVLGLFWLFRYCMNFGAKWPKWCLWCKLRTTKWHRNFLQRTHPSTPLDPKLMFWGISDHSVTARTSVQNGPNWSN
jgi:hypothetical protein